MRNPSLSPDVLLSDMIKLFTRNYFPIIILCFIRFWKKNKYSSSHAYDNKQF